MNRILTFFIFLLLFIGYFHPITAINQDLGRHLLTGKIILQTLSFPTTNLFSYTFADFPFINHHWLSEVLFYTVQSLTGYLGLFILALGIIVTAFGLVFFQAARVASFLVLSFISVIYLRILFERTDIRPELFSFLFFAVMITILFRFREGFTKLIYLLIPLELVWVNTHIYFPIGILILILFSLDAAVTNRHQLFAKKPKTLFLVTLAAGLITLVNPHGLDGATYPLRVFQNYGYTIEENQTPFLLESLGFHKPSYPYLQLAIILLFGSLFFTMKKTRLIDWLLAITFTAIALSAVRNFPLFAFATLIPCARSLTIAVSLLKATFSHQQRFLLQCIAGVSLIAIVIWQGNIVVTEKSFGYGVEESGKEALTFFEQNNIKGPIFNNFDIGSYIESRLYPKERVFIDGRPEAYPAVFLKDTYIKMQEDKKVFDTMVDKYNINAVIFSHTDQTPWAEKFLPMILTHPSWRLIYLDSFIVILLKDTPDNKMLIAKYYQPVDKMQMKMLSSDRKHLLYAAHFYSLIYQPQRLEHIFQEILKRDPNNCSVLASLIALYQREQNPTAAILLQQYQLQCQ